MEESPAGLPPSVRSGEGRLDSWKEIAAYFNRDVSTVQRWEKREAMPVHRHLHSRMGSVHAFRAELEAWARTRNLRPAPDEEIDIPLPSDSSGVFRPLRSSFLRRWPLVLLLTVAVALAIGAILGFRTRDLLWRNPLADARFQRITDFDGAEQAAAVSRDGQFVAFLSDRDGQMDVWVTQVGSEQFHNLTRGRAPELVNPSLRTLGFSPDGTLITFWGRRQNAPQGDHIGIWAVPTLGGEPRQYLEGIAEYDWSHDGSRLAYHTPGAGDPLFVSENGQPSQSRSIFTAPTGLHSHFPLWAPDGRFVYFVQGSLPDKLDIWRIAPSGGAPERMTSHNAQVTYPVLLNRRTLLYLAQDADGSGPWLYGMNVEGRIPHRLNWGPERYTSLAASADGRRLVATLTSLKRTLWRLPITDSPASTPARIALTTGTGFSPRLGPSYMVYVSRSGASDSIWKLAAASSSELWKNKDARILGAPAVSPDGRKIAFAAEQHRQLMLYTMDLDGTNAKIVSDSLAFQGAPTWAPDTQSIIVAAAEHDTPHLFRVPLDGRAPVSLTHEYSLDPAWSPDGRLLIYSGPDVGTTFSVKAVSFGGAAQEFLAPTLTRGARHLVFLNGSNALIFLRGEIRHKDLWLIDLKTGIQKQLTHLNPDFDVGDFDISPDGHEVVLERVEERSDIGLLDLSRR